MKIVQVILLMILITKASLGMGLTSLSGNGCCSEQETELSVEQNDSHGSDDKDCCDGPSCDCMCCGHVFVSYTTWNLDIQKLEINTSSIFNYQVNHTVASQGNIWHPPKNLQ